MRRLLLLRHAKAVPAEHALDDIARPLAKRGERDAQRIGERLRAHQLLPTLILASPATRTLQTAQLVAASVNYPRGAIALEQRLYLAEPATIVDVVAAQAPAVESLLIVGHNPGLTQAVHDLLATFDVDDMPTGAVVALEYASADDWAAVGHAVSRLTYYDFPKNTSAPATTR